MRVDSAYERPLSPERTKRSAIADLPSGISVGPHMIGESRYWRVRVHPEQLAKQHLPPRGKDQSIWKNRFEEINCFERYLVDNGIIVLKLFLNVSKKEQKVRFLKRIDEKEKNWKFSSADALERRHWEE